jgi:hypothetical protein
MFRRLDAAADRGGHAQREPHVQRQRPRRS